jgi:hypothetical protein
MTISSNVKDVYVAPPGLEIIRPNFTRVAIGKICFYFSYQTVVAFYFDEDLWSTTTGKHINAVCNDKSKRLPRHEFEARLQAALVKTIR